MSRSSKVLPLRDPRSDAELVVAACDDDDRRAKAVLFRRHVDRVAGTVYRLLGRDDDLDDLVHDFEQTR